MINHHIFISSLKLSSRAQHQECSLVAFVRPAGAATTVGRLRERPPNRYRTARERRGPKKEAATRNDAARSRKSLSAAELTIKGSRPGSAVRTRPAALRTDRPSQRARPPKSARRQPGCGTKQAGGPPPSVFLFVLVLPQSPDNFRGRGDRTGEEAGSREGLGASWARLQRASGPGASGRGRRGWAAEVGHGPRPRRGRAPC